MAQPSIYGGVYLSYEPEAFKNIRTILAESYGPSEKRVVVLGSFDTWSYMDFVCRRLAEMKYTVFTSRYVYKEFQLPSGTSSIERVQSIKPKEMDTSLVQYLKQMLNIVKKAVIIYSVCGAHYIETDWLSEGSIWNVLGLTFVRSIGEENSCLAVNEKLGYSICNARVPKRIAHGESPIWNCLEKHWCPFQKQDMSKDVIERYLMNKHRMVLVAIESLDNVKNVLEAWELERIYNEKAWKRRKAPK